jgi:tetratricopeptide (TPR) repeat protein
MKPGVDYKLIVAAGNGAISDEPGIGLGFSLLNSKDAKAVLQEQTQIESLGLPPGPTDFLIAHLYADHGLYAEAIERLEEISQKFKVAAVQKLLGDLFMDIGLPRQAEGRYLSALDLSAVENDEEGQMLVHKALAYIYQQILGNNETASQQLSKALELARKLGDDSTASQAGKQLAEMKRAGT